MPRPKVRPENRQRSSKACLPCQASKIRCDSQTPCTSCVRRDRSATCTYAESQKRRSSKTHHNREVRFVSRNDHAIGTSASTRVTTSAESRVRASQENDDNATKNASILAPPVQSPGGTESRLLLSSKGEKGSDFHIFLVPTVAYIYTYIIS